MKNIRMMLFALLLLVGFSTSHAQQDNKVRVACIGDSVTEGLGLKDPANEAYPAVLQRLLGDGFEVKNFGLSGATLLRHGHRPYEKTKPFAEMKQYPADIAIIHLGLNDTDPRNFPFYRDEFLQDYSWLISQVREASPNAKIYICSLTPIFTGHSRFTSSTYDWYNILQGEIYKLYWRHGGVDFIDLNSSLRYFPNLVNDGPTLHPNKRGAEKMAECVYSYITGDFGGLKVDPIWGSHMVLPQETWVTISGTADTFGAPVFVTFDHQEEPVQIGVKQDGKWTYTFKTPKGSHKSHDLKIYQDGQTLHFTDILVGEVWLAMGQSNMEWPLKHITGGEQLAPSADPKRPVRLFRLKEMARTDNVAWSNEALDAANELDFYHGSWSKDTEGEALDFSGIAYTFGRRLHEELDVPVGVVQFAVGGSPLLSWVNRYMMLGDPYFHGAFLNWRKTDYMMKWVRDRATSNLGSRADDPFQRHSYEPSFNHEAGRRQLGNFPFSGVLWYQGESDAENAELHDRLFPIFVEDLRQQHGAKLPIYTVQLSSILRSNWPWFRWHQAMLARDIEGLHMAISHDYGNPKDVHPHNKMPIAERLVQLALRHNYGWDIVADSPIPAYLFDPNNSETAERQIHFAESNGLLATTDGGPVKGLEAIKATGERAPLTAEIAPDRRSLIIYLPRLDHITDIVYAWDPVVSKEANLCYEGGQPAGSFRIGIIGE